VSQGRSKSSRSIAFFAIAAIWMHGCSTNKGTGTLAGAGIGALVGQVAGGDTTSTLVGAAVGTGVGYIIGDQLDEKKAREMSAAGNPNPEVTPLAGTRWRLVSLNTTKPVDPYTSKVVDFRPDGRVITTTNKPGGGVLIADESYRIVGSTLIVNKPGYLINARFRIDGGNRLIIDDPGFSAVLERA